MRRLSAFAALLVVAACSDEATTGADGMSWLTAVTPAASGCPGGGVTVSVGPDENHNDVLDAAEVKSTALVCNGDDGAAGSDGDSWLVATEEAQLGTCAWGGTVLHVGRDLDASNTLELAEYVTNQTVCNGAVVSTGTTIVWTGAGANDRWTNPANWQGGRLPRAGDILSFPETATQKRTQNDFPVGTAFGSILIVGNYELYGKKAIVVDVLEAKDDTVIELALALNGPLTVRSSDTLTVTGAIEGTGTVTSEAGGSVALVGANTFTGQLVARSFITRIAGTGALGVSLDPGRNLEVAAGGASFSGLSCLPGNSLTLTGDLTVTHSADIECPTTGSGDVIMQGSNSLSFNGGTSYPGTIYVRNGRLQSGSTVASTHVVVSSGGIVENNALFASLTAETGGLVRPLGQINFAGSAAFTGGTLEPSIDGTSSTQYDTLYANTVTISGGSTLNLDLGFTPALNDSFVLISATAGLTGEFVNHPQGSNVVIGGVTLDFLYTASQLIVTVIAD